MAAAHRGPARGAHDEQPPALARDGGPCKVILGRDRGGQDNTISRRLNSTAKRSLVGLALYGLLPWGPVGALVRTLRLREA
jgi:hypothetical protein